MISISEFVFDDIVPPHAPSERVHVEACQLDDKTAYIRATDGHGRVLDYQQIDLSGLSLTQVGFVLHMRVSIFVREWYTDMGKDSYNDDDDSIGTLWFNL